MDENTVRLILYSLIERKQEYINLSNRQSNKTSKLAFQNQICGLNIALDKIYQLARFYGIDVSDVNSKETEIEER